MRVIRIVIAVCGLSIPLSGCILAPAVFDLLADLATGAKEGNPIAPGSAGTLPCGLCP